MVHSDTVEHAKVRLLALASRFTSSTKGHQRELVQASEVYARAMADRCGSCLGRGIFGHNGLWGYAECGACHGTGKRVSGDD